MREIKNLLSLELKSLFGINKFLHNKDKKQRRNYLLLSVCFCLLILTAIAYVVGQTVFFCEMGLGQTVFLCLSLVLSILIIMVGIFSTAHHVFDAKGFDVILSLPVKTRSIVISRFLFSYIENLLITSLIMISGLVVYAVYFKPSFAFYVFAFACFLIMPIIPQLISTVIGSIILAISARVKSKNLVQTLLSVILVVGVLVLSFSMQKVENLELEQMKAVIEENLSNTLSIMAIFCVWANNAIVFLDVKSLLLLVGISLALLIVCLFIIIKIYKWVVFGLSKVSTKGNYKLGELQKNSQLKTLYVKEVKSYLSSSIYVTNTILSPIMALAFAIVTLFLNLDEIALSLQVGLDLRALVPFVFSMIISFTTTTCVSISMEGRKFWIVKSLPIKTKTWLDAKILLGLTLTLPAYIISQIIFIFSLKPQLVEFIFLALIPFCVILFSSVMGIAINLKLANFDWDREQVIVKQSASAFFGYFLGPVLGIVGIILACVIPTAFTHIFEIVFCVAILILTIVCYNKNNKTEITRL